MIYKIEIIISGDEIVFIDNVIDFIKDSRIGAICDKIDLYKKEKK